MADKKAMQQAEKGPVNSDPTERLIEERSEKEICKAMTLAARKSPKKALFFVADTLRTQLYGQAEKAYAALQVKTNAEIEEKIEKASEQELSVIVAVLTAITKYEIEGFAQKLGVKMSEIEKSTAAVVKKEIEAAKNPKQQAKEAGDKDTNVAVAKGKAKKA